MIELRDVTFWYDDAAGPRTASTSSVEEGELVLVSGPTGVGQVHAARRGHRPGAALLRRHARRRRAARRRQHRRTGRRASAPTRSATSGRTPPPGFVTDTVEEELAYGMEQLGLAAADDAPPGRGDARPARHRRPAPPRPAHPLRRPAAAGRDRLGADHAPAAARARRADLGARPDRGRGRAGHARPGWCDDLGVSVLLAEHRLERVVPFADRMVLLDRRRPGPRRRARRAAGRLAGRARRSSSSAGLAGWDPLPLQRARRPAPGARARDPAATAARRAAPVERAARRLTARGVTVAARPDRSPSARST